MVIKAGMLRRMTCEKLGWGAGRHCLRSARLFFFFPFAEKWKFALLQILKGLGGGVKYSAICMQWFNTRVTVVNSSCSGRSEDCFGDLAVSYWNEWVFTHVKAMLKVGT